MSQTWPSTRASVRLALTAVMSALIAVTTVIAIPMPPPLSTLNFAPAVIFITSILMGPWIGLVAATIGSGLGFIGGASLGTIAPPPGFFYVFLWGIIIARGPMGFGVGALRKTNELAAMTVGVLIETIIFFLADWYLFGFEISLVTLGTLIDLIHVPIASIVLLGIRRALNIKHLV